MPEAPNYDVFVSYAEADRAWVEGYLLAALEQAGVRCMYESAFALGVPRLLEFERSIQQSKRTLLVISPNYLADGLNEFIATLGQSYGQDTNTWPVIPLIRQSVPLPPRLGMLVGLKATNEKEQESAIAQLCADLKRPLPAPAPPPDCPYPGMKPFGLGDRDRFFGREEEVNQLLEHLRLHPFITVIGPSGSGKSSLVFAGLIPALRETRLFGSGGWRIQSMRPGESPQTTLKQALASGAQQKAARMLLLVDQFEELFTLAKEEAIPFQESLLKLVKTPNVYLVLTVRADFYADLMTSLLWQEIQSYRLEVVPLTETGLRQAILKPAEAVGVFIEPALVERLVTDAAGEPGVLPLIQETLVLLWQRLERRFLPLRAYEAIVLPRTAYGGQEPGRKTGLLVAIARRADVAYAALANAQQRTIARRIFLRLIQFGRGRADTRRQQPVEMLRAVGDEPNAFDHTLQHLVDRRLLTLSSEGVLPTVDIAHEALISGWPLLRQWIAERREAEQIRRRLSGKAEEWVRLGLGKGGLLDSVELSEAERWLSSLDALDLGYSKSLPALVLASRIEIEERERQEEEHQQRELQLTQARLKQEIKARKSARLTSVIAVASLIVLTILTAISIAFGRNATSKALNALSASSEAYLASNQELEALLEGIAAGRMLKRTLLPATEDRTRVVATLGKVVHQLRESNRLQGFGNWVTSVGFSPDGKQLVTASMDKTVKLWSRQGKELRTFLGHQGGVLEVGFSPDGKIIASASEDKTIKLWDLNGREIATLKGHQNWVANFSFSPDNQKIASASLDSTIRLWNRSGREINILRGHNGPVWEVSFSPDGQTIASAGKDGTIKLWSLKGKLLKTFVGHRGDVASLSFSPNGKAIVSGGKDQTVRLWDVSGHLLRVMSGHVDQITNVRFSPDGKTIASASADDTIKLWTLDGSLLQTLRGHQGDVSVVRFSPDGKTIASSSFDQTVKLWNLDGMSIVLHQPEDRWSNDIVFSPDGRFLVSAVADDSISGYAAVDPTLKLWTREGRLLHSFKGHKQAVLAVSFSPDNQTIASASTDKTIRLWKVDGNLLDILQGHSSQVNDVEFSPDGKTIASASDDKTVKLWNLDGTLRQTIQGHSDRVLEVRFSPDGRMIASASMDKTVRLWQLDGTSIQRLQGNGRMVGISFSPNGQTLAAASDDKTVHLWHRAGQAFQPLKNPLRGHSDAITSVDFSPDGRILATASADSTIKLWSFKGDLLQTLREHKDWVRRVRFSPDSNTLASASLDHTVILWNLNLDNLLVQSCRWIQDYLNNTDLEERDQQLCKHITS